MKFTSTDAWLLLSIHHSQGSDGTSLKSVIAFADYVNHAIITYRELTTSLSKLLSVSLVIMENDSFKTSKDFHQWRSKNFKGKKSVQPLKELVEIEKYLNATFAEAKQEVVTSNISEEQYREAVDRYTNG